jgi:hypothetical protein
VVWIECLWRNCGRRTHGNRSRYASYDNFRGDDGASERYGNRDTFGNRTWHAVNPAPLAAVQTMVDY